MLTEMAQERIVNRKLGRGETTRQELVDAATRLFAERGYEDTSIEAVLGATGVSRGALYHHFAGKEALFEAVLDEVERGVAQAVVDAVAEVTDPVEALRKGTKAWLELTSDPVVRRISLIDAPSVVGWEKWRGIDERHGFGLTKHALESLAEAGHVRPELVDVLAHVLLAALVEVALLIARSEDPVAATKAGEAAIDRLLESFVSEA
jgi:AcrR family transcriptional regulator